MVPGNTRIEEDKTLQIEDISSSIPGGIENSPYLFQRYTGN
jgi:hypothetical protein